MIISHLLLAASAALAIRHKTECSRTSGGNSRSVAEPIPDVKRCASGGQGKRTLAHVARHLVDLAIPVVEQEEVDRVSGRIKYNVIQIDPLAILLEIVHQGGGPGGRNWRFDSRDCVSIIPEPSRSRRMKPLDLTL